MENYYGMVRKGRGRLLGRVRERLGRVGEVLGKRYGSRMYKRNERWSTAFGC